MFSQGRIKPAAHFGFRLRAMQRNECGVHQLINSQWPVMSILFMVGLVNVLTETNLYVLHWWHCCIFFFFSCIAYCISFFRLLEVLLFFSFISLSSVYLHLCLTEICFSDRAPGNREKWLHLRISMDADTHVYSNKNNFNLTHTHTHLLFYLLLDYSHRKVFLDKTKWCFLLLIILVHPNPW